MKLKQNQQGFSPLIIILILLLLAALGFAGWRVWDSKKTTDDTKASTSTPKERTDPEERPALSYVKPISEAYRVVLPDTWVSATCDDNPDILFLAPTTDKLGKCQSDSGGTLSLSKNAGNIGHNEEYYTSDDYYGDVVYTPVSGEGVTGYKVSYTIATESVLGFPPVGTKQVVYSLYDGTDTYSTIYTRMSGEADHSATVQTVAESLELL